MSDHTNRKLFSDVWNVNVFLFGNIFKQFFNIKILKIN
jgi:hypothetical protein